MLKFLVPLRAETDGNLFLDWVKVGAVIPGSNDTFTFVYQPNEDVNTVWQGNSTCSSGVVMYDAYVHVHCECVNT